jgi:hypothetical protein
MLLQYWRTIHSFLESIPDRLYPFASDIEGEWVRGRQSYRHAVTSAFAKHGPNQYGFTLILYRSFFHMVGGILFVVAATIVAEEWFSTEIALYVFVAAGAFALFVQEFYTHPRKYGQLRLKSYADWLTWVIPMVLTLIFWQ